jgi:hypothetical protein
MVAPPRRSTRKISQTEISQTIKRLLQWTIN